MIVAKGEYLFSLARNDAGLSNLLDIILETSRLVIYK